MSTILSESKFALQKSNIGKETEEIIEKKKQASQEKNPLVLPQIQ